MDSPAEHFRTSVLAAHRGDSNAYDELFGRNMPALLAYLRARVSDRLARLEPVEDLAQSVCREVLRDLPGLQFGREEQFRAYLFLQARRKVVDRHRYYEQDKRNPARQQGPMQCSEHPGLAEVLASWATPSQVASGKEELARVERALEQLPDAQREAVLLSRIAGLAYSDIATLTDASESAVRGLVARGLARLTRLTGRGAGAPAADPRIAPDSGGTTP